MSRIHEALRKAELERTGGLNQPGPDPAALSATVAAPESLAPEPSASLAGRRIPAAPFEPITLESLRQQCTVCNWQADPNGVLFSAGAAHPSGSEEFRTLRSRLYHIREKQPLQALLVTSALPGEGKTFVTLNLARAMAQQPHRSVLVIDADLRISRMHEVLGTSASPGLSDYLKGDASAVAIIQRGAEENLFFIPAGTFNSNPLELLGTGSLKALLNSLTPIFDWIILDSPPAVFLSDASLLGKVCDGVLMVVQSGATPFDSAQKARREFQDKQLVGVVLNRVPQGMGYGYYYYYRYGHEGTEAKNGKK